MKTIKTVIHYYQFDISNENEQTQYQELSEKLKAQGLKLFDFISSVGSGRSEIAKEMEFENQIKAMSGKEIELETDFLFNNQWNTAPLKEGENGLRVFDWSEKIYPNKRLKCGHWLEQTEQMTALRKDTCKCGYCGKNYYKPKQDFCSQCLDGEYLTEDNLPLLYLVPISEEDKRDYKIPVPDSLVNGWKESQRIARTKRNEKHKIDKLKDLKDKIIEAQTEFDAFQWLIEHNVDFDNVIYYSHIKTFSFGWRTSLSQEQKEQLGTVLKDFPYQWEFNKK